MDTDTDLTTSTLEEPVRPTMVSPTATVTVGDLREHLHGTMIGDSEGLAHLEETLVSCANMLLKAEGGTTIVLLHEDLKNSLYFGNLDGGQLTLDNGQLTRVCRRQASNVIDKPAQFEAILVASSSHSEDRWSPGIIDTLVARLGVSSEEDIKDIRCLQGHPLDGAFVVSWRGTVLAAAAAIMLPPPCSYTFVHANGRSSGTRHTSGLHCAEWMGSQKGVGVVLLRSDSGSVHAILSNGSSAPLIYKVELPEVERQPDLILTLNIVDRADDRITLSCTGMGGTEVARVAMEPSKDSSTWLRIAVAEGLPLPKHRLKLVLRDGRIAPRKLSDLLALIDGPLV